MDWLYSSDWLTEYKLPIGKWAKQIFTWLNENGGPVFEFLRFIMQSVIDGCLFVLTETPPLLIVAAFLGLTWYIQRSWKTVALVALSFLFILNQGY